MNLHVYKNKVIDFFVAESVSELHELYKQYNTENFGITEISEMDLDFTQIPDDKIISIKIDPYGPDDKETMTAKEFANSNGKGLLASTEY